MQGSGFEKIEQNRREELMKTKFTTEEMYQSYRDDIIDALIHDFKIDLSMARNVIAKAKLKERFFNKMQDFDFLEPNLAAKQYYETHLKFIHGYQHYKGDIWISKQKESLEIQGTNIVVLKNEELKVLGYVIRKNDQWTYTHSKYVSLEEMVWSVLKSCGWSDEYCNKILTDKE